MSVIVQPCANMQSKPARMNTDSHSMVSPSACRSSVKRRDEKIKKKQNKTKQNKTKQNKTKQNKTKQNKTKRRVAGRECDLQQRQTAAVLSKMRAVNELQFGSSQRQKRTLN